MAVLVTSRAQLDEWLERVQLSILVLSGPRDGATEAVHDLAEEAFAHQQTWRKTAFVVELALLTADERAAWVDGPDRYAMVARTTREVVERGPIDDLVRSDGEPSIRALRRVFHAGD